MYLFFLRIKISILVLFLCLIAAQQRCDNSICNHEAVCILVNDKPSCKCVGKFFEGEFCTKPIDNCIQNPCKNGGTCHPYPGHYYCECSPGYSAQKCTSKQKTFKGLHLHYNHIASIGEQQSLILILQDLGNVETLMEFFTPDYIIDGVAFSPSSGHFKSTSDIKSLSNQLDIRHTDQLPYNEGFYRISHATFWKLGTHKMVLDLSDFELTAENFFTQHFEILVYDPTGVQCIPVIHLPHCSNPRKALHIDIATFDFVEPIVDERCEEHSQLRIQWSVRNYINTVVLHTFLEDVSTVLTIPPYTMWFNYRDDFLQSYLIQGDVREMNPEGRVISRTVLRCYVFVDSKPTTAHILGGNYREMNVDKDFVIDASISRDYARRPNQDQQLEYSWSCESEDIENSYCLNNMGTNSHLHIPPRALKFDQTYTYTVQVRSSINIYSTHRAFQKIKPVSEDPLLINFVCLRNCEHDTFAAGKVIHLKIECIGCPAGQVTYSVLNEQGTEVATSQRVILTENSKKEISLKAHAKLGSHKGTASIKLKRNNPPSKGNCKISPTNGIEYQTIFDISCPGYQDEDKPINYKYRAGNMTLDHIGNSTLSTRLFPTSGQKCEITISICDDIGACTEVQLQATLSPISAPGSWVDFLSQNETNLRGLIGKGDRSAAVVLIRSVIPHMPPDESFKIAEFIVKSLRDLELSRLLVVEQVLTTGKDLFEAMKLSSDSAGLISELFVNISDGLLHSIQNEEIIELPLETHEQMIDELTQSMTKATEEVEEFPMVHDAESFPLEDPFLENYTDYGELNMEDVVHIGNWLQCFNSMHRCLQVMGVVSAFIQLPDENPVMIKRKGITSRTLVIDKSEAVSLSWNESSTFLSLPDEFLKTLKGQEVAIQVSIFEANPFWWNPEQYKLNTEVLSVGAYTKDLASLKSSSTKVAFNFFMRLQGGIKIDKFNIIHGSVNGSLDMPIYKKLIPANAVLVVTFLPLDTDIRILFTIDEKPRSFMLAKATEVKASKENTTVSLVNHFSKPHEVFLAVSSQSYTNFSFTMVVRLCLTWHPSIFEWTSEHCSVGSETNGTHIHCSCWHLSMFGAKVHPTFGYQQASSGIVKDLPLNFGMITFYLFIIVLLCFVLWLARRRDLTVAAGLVALNSKPGPRAKHKYLVTIYTNGHGIAGTTSNVTIQLHGSLSDSVDYTLYSKPCNLLFQRNVQTSFKIFSEGSLGTLEYISLQHDSFGRYPTWNCHMVKVRDEDESNEYIFMVNTWLSDYESTSCAAFVPLTRKERLQRRSRIFRDSLGDGFANWYAQQSVCCLRLYGNLTTMEKTAIFTVRFCLTVVGTIIAFGPTTMFTYEEERETYYSMLLDIGRLLVIAFCCHLVGLAAAVVLQYLFLKLRSSEKRAN